jgi:ribose 5-phosphate isomerase RpiB
LSIGERFVDEKDLEEIILVWLEESFSKEDRHLRRINKF